MVIMVCLPKSENKRRPHQVYFSPSEKYVNSASTIVERMSALGQKRTYALQQRMSALGQKRTHAAQQKGSLFDHLIGGDQQARWNCQAKCLRRFAVDDSFELRRRLHRKVSGFCTAQDAVDIGCPLSRQIDEVSPVIHETARCDENTGRVNRGQAMPSC